MTNLFIGPYKEGLERNVEPWLQPNEAFTLLEDADIYQGRVEKKQGYSLLGRLHWTPALPENKGNAAMGATVFFLTLNNRPVSPGTAHIRLAIPVWGNFEFTDNGNGTLTATTIPPGMSWGYGQIAYETGGVTLFWDAALPAVTPITAQEYRWLNRLPCMGLAARELTSLNRIQTVAFDLWRSYVYNGATEQFDLITAGNCCWDSSETDFMWTANYWEVGGAPLLWATNNVAYLGAGLDDGIKYFNGATWTTLAAPINVAGGIFLRGALIVLPFKDRLVSLNTLEGLAPPAVADRYLNRARWCQNGNPTTIAPAASSAWRDDIAGRGGYIDAPTNEAIVSAWYTKDTVVVFFEKSTWQLVYSGNEELPFYWKRLSAELGAISTFSQISFDKGVMAIGNYGIVMSDGLNVERIDEKIPNFAMGIEQDYGGVYRVHGIRDFGRKRCLWAFPPQGFESIYPSKVLSLNYEEKTFSTHADSFTCFGNYQADEDYTWATINKTWEAADIPWLSPGLQAFYPEVIAGNQQSFVLRLNKGSSNSICMDLRNQLVVPSISNTNPALINCFPHNLDTGQFVKIHNTFGFVEGVVGEALGTAPAGTTTFRGTLAHLGAFPTNIVVTDSISVFQDMGNGVLTTVAGITGTVDYTTGDVSLVFPAPIPAARVVSVDYSYNILNGRIFYVERESISTFSIYNVAADGTLSGVDLSGYGLPYRGAGSLEVVYSVHLKTKRFSPFIAEGKAFRLIHMDLFMDTNDGDFCIQMHEDQMPADPSLLLEASNKDDKGKASGKHWNRYFPGITSDFVQLEFKCSLSQMTKDINVYSDFVLHAMSLNVTPAGRV